MVKFFIFSLFFSMYINAHALSRVGVAKVYSQGKIICFTIQREEFQRAAQNIIYFFGYSINKKTEDQWETVWGYYTKTPAPLKEGECIAYGVLPEWGVPENNRQGIQLPTIAPALRTNIIYSLSIRGHANIDYDPTSGYAILFCLQEKDRAIIIRQGRGNYASCDQLNSRQLKPVD